MTAPVQVEPKSNATLSAADAILTWHQEYGAAGYEAIPIRLTLVTDSRGKLKKRPRFPGGTWKTAREIAGDPERLRQALTDGYLDVALVCENGSGQLELVVLDFDRREGESLEDVKARSDAAVEKYSLTGAVVEDSGRGRHVIVAAPPRLHGEPWTKFKLGPPHLVDEVIAGENLLFATPSLHPIAMCRYTRLTQLPPVTELPVCPEELLHPPKDKLPPNSQEVAHSGEDSARAEGGSRLDLIGLFKEEQLYLKQINGEKHSVRCPWESQHTSGSDGTDTVLLGGNGDGVGFKCLHAHCEARTLQDIREFFGSEVVDRWTMRNGDSPPKPLFDPIKIRFRRFLESEPPDRRDVLPGVLPLGIAGSLASEGGAGKSMLIYQFGFSVTSGVPFLEMEIGDPGGFLYVAAEDDEDELHRRGYAVLAHYRRLAKEAGETLDEDAVADRLHVVSRVAEDNLLTRLGRDGEVSTTPLLASLIEAARRIPDLRVAVLDPTSRFRGGRANNEEDATRFVEAAEQIRVETGATVLTLSHVSQLGMKEGGGQEIVRGSTGFVDGMRWVATLQKLREKQAEEYGVSEAEAVQYLRFDIPKTNYTGPFAGMWLRRNLRGIITPTELERVEEPGRGTKAEREYGQILGRLRDLLQREGAMTERKIRDDWVGLHGVLRAGDKTVRSVISRAVHEGSIERDSDDGLHLPPGHWG